MGLCVVLKVMVVLVIGMGMSVGISGGLMMFCLVIVFVKGLVLLVFWIRLLISGCCMKFFCVDWCLILVMICEICMFLLVS